MATPEPCADCGRRAPAGEARCPACGGQRLETPPAVFSRRSVLLALLAAGSVVLAAFTALMLAMPIALLASAGVTFPWDQERRTRSLDRQWDAIRDAERAVPLPPGAARVGEVHGLARDGAARTLAVCWDSPGGFDEARRFLVAHLSHPESGWRALGAGTRAFRKGRVYLAIDAPAEARPACEGAFQLTFVYQV